MASVTPGAVMALLTGRKKLERLNSLLDRLRLDLEEKPLSQADRSAILEEVKVYGRVAASADPIFTKLGINTLARHGFDGSSPSASREAFRCLANALLLKSETRQILVDFGYADKAAERLKTDLTEDEFLLSRILFLMTYDTNLDFGRLVREKQLAESINSNIARHSKRYSKSRRSSQSNPMDDMALTETLKLLFNITHHYPDLIEDFSKSIPHLFKILSRISLPRPVLQPPIAQLINALLNLDLEDKRCGHFSVNPVFPGFDKKCNAEHLINILDKSATQYPEAELEKVAAPVLTLIRRIYEIAPEGVKKYMEWLLLPTDDERSRPLGQLDTLSSRLLRLSTSALAPTLRESIQSLMFELSGKDASQFVKNIGYGFASGFLMNHGMEIPQSAMEAWSAEGDHGEDGDEAGVNPVTGQRLADEIKEEIGTMTEEEKEREAERLFVLFERLKATGVVDVKNPVEQAIQEGRFEELD